MFIEYFKQNLKSLRVNDKMIEFELCSLPAFKEILKPFNMQSVSTFNARYDSVTLKGIDYNNWLFYYIIIRDNVKEIYEIIVNNNGRFIRSKFEIQLCTNGEYVVLREVYKDDEGLTRDINVSIKKIVKGKVTVVEENTNKKDLAVDWNKKYKEDQKTLERLEYNCYNRGTSR